MMKFFASAPLLFALLILLYCNVMPSSAKKMLYSGEILNTGSSITSAGLKLSMQRDCDLVLRGVNDEVLWYSNTQNADENCYLYLSYNGVLEIRSGDRLIWYSDQSGVSDNYILVLMPQGIAVVYGGAGLWYTPLP